LTGHVGPTEVM